MNNRGKRYWEDCSPETIASMVTSVRRQTRRAMLKRIGLTSASLFTAIAGTTFWWAGRQPSREQIRIRLIRPISCPEAREKFGLLVACQLDDATSRRMRCHLTNCRPCCRQFSIQFPDSRLLRRSGIHQKLTGSLPRPGR
jgi:hypothetical protein